MSVHTEVFDLWFQNVNFLYLTVKITTIITNTKVVSGVATGGSRGAEFPLNIKTIAKNWEKEGENQEKREKEEKLGRFFHFTPPDRLGWLSYWR